MSRHGRFYAIAITALTVVSGCGNPAPAGSASAPLVASATPVATASATATPPPGRNYDARAYELRGEFDWSARRLHAKEHISVVLRDPSQPTVELDAAVAVRRVHARGRDLPYTVDAQAKTLTVDLGALRPGRAPVGFTVEYDAATSDALIASTGRDGDPNRSRVVYTDSEPDRGSQWLVANHHPADRARWSVELTVAADEDVVANGHRVADERCDGHRTVRYEIDEPLPTYLMAFAAGQLEHTDRDGGRVPLSVWYRRGLVVDASKSLDAVADAMHTFEALLGPYPWERYSIVLVPDYYGGMENATITFMYEPSGQGTIDFTTNAHELGHHWFGDWVTMRDFDDVWIKEGMATVLESEADRARRDQAGLGRLFGSDFYFRPTDAVIDPTRKGLAKYTSGPYGRAAWMLTQIRATVGEQQFWRTLRRVLRQHALDSVDTASFVRSFAPALDEASIAKLLATLTQTTLPSIATSGQYGPDGTTVTLTLSDPAGAILATPTLRVVDAAGQVGPEAALAVGTPVTLTLPWGGYFAVDEADVHSDFTSTWNVDDGYWSYVASSYLPQAAAAQATLGARSAAQQERAFTDGWFSGSADDFATLYGALDSTLARHDAEILGCYNLYYGASDPSGATVASWLPVLGPILQHGAIEWYEPSYGACGTTLATQYLAGELGSDVQALDAGDAGRVGYLMSFDYGVAPSFALLGKVATGAPTLQLRQYATERLAAQAAGQQLFSRVDATSAPAWKELFRQKLAETTSAGFFSTVWSAVNGLSDDGALVLAAGKLHTVPLTAATQRKVVCDAWRIAQVRAEAWSQFQDAAQPWTTLAPAAQAVLAAPATCTAPPPAARVRDAAPLAVAAPRAVDAAPLAVDGAAAAAGASPDRPDAHVGERARRGAPSSARPR